LPKLKIQVCSKIWVEAGGRPIFGPGRQEFLRRNRHSAVRSWGRRSILGLGILLAGGFLLWPGPAQSAANALLIFAGAASKPPTEEIARMFEQKVGGPIRATFGGSGFVLSQMKLSRKGDIYFPGSSDFMAKAKKERLVFPETEKIVAYLIPAINVQKGNPLKIHSLRDLLRPGVRLAIADPEIVCVGMYAVEVIEKNLRPEEREQLRKNLVTTVESCEKVANIISLKGVDAVLGWKVFAQWDPERIETILLKPQEVPRIGYLPLAVSIFTANRLLAEQFIQFLAFPEAQAVFRRHGYLMSQEEARVYVLPDTPIGGEYTLPAEWIRRSK
jgi:molybdate transport system substrate-binding protein